MRDRSSPDGSPLTRRRTLRTLLGTATAGLVAGCNSSDDDPTTANGTSGPTLSPTATPTPLPAATLTPTPIPTPTPTPSPTATATATPSAVSSSARAFVADLETGAFESARDALAPLAAQQLSANTLERLWLGLTAQHGPFERVADERRTTENGAPVVVLTLRCGQGEQRVRFTFDAEGRIAGLRFPAEYAPPAYADRSAFSERDVTVDAEGCALPGTLSVPDGDGPAPGVVLVHGSGPTDRDSTVGPNKPLKDLAWGLASRGIAVLRYEKRTYACDVPRSDWDIDTVAVDDAVRALGVLADREAVDPDRRFVVGHSLGAVCTPRIASRADGLAGGAMLAANARPITEVIRDQVRHLLSVDGELSAEDEDRLASIDEQLTRVENGEVAPDETVQGLPGSWYASLLDYDQVATAGDVSQPLFLLQGGRDYQVPPATEFERWREALGDRADTRFERYPALSHLFQPGTEPSLGTEYNFHDSVAERVVADLADWVRATTG